MKIVFISLMNDAPWGGSEVLWSKTASLALHDKHEVLITAYQHPVPALPLVNLVAEGAELFYRDAYRSELHIRLLRRLKQTLKPISAELQRIKEYNPDVVFVNQGGYNDVIYKKDVWAWLTTGKIPYLIICHLYQDPVKITEDVRGATLAAYQNARSVLTISHKQTLVLERQLATALPNAQVIQNPLNIPAQIPLSFPKIEVPQLAVVASLDSDRKGQDVLFQALSSSVWQARQWQLNVYGKGPDHAYLEQLATYYSIKHKVVFHGHLADSADIWRANHLLVISSRIESGPMVLLEAMLAGRPVVSTDVGLVGDWLHEGDTGFIAEASLPGSLSLALERAWQQQRAWAEMGLRAHAYAKAHVQPEPARVMLDIITKQANNHSRSN
jgi:glycosyltransferase involved in cell wall biosynthesis